MNDDRLRAHQTVQDKLAAALRREGLARAEVEASPGFLAEIADAEEKLALAYRRRAVADAEARGSGAADVLVLAHDSVVRLEQLATEGHNLHPCGRTRLGWTIADAEAHDLESDGTTVGFVGVPEEGSVGDDLGERFGVSAPRGLVARPVHAWQLAVVRDRYGLPVLEREMPAKVTAAVRTLWVPELDAYLKLSLDVQITSTRRTISIASTRNGPMLSAQLPRLLAECGGDRVRLLGEPAGAASNLGNGRDLSAILREPMPAMAPGEQAVPAIALAQTCPITGLTVAELLRRRSGRTPHEFLAAYARLVLPPVLGMVTRFGVGLEAHLQNCIVTFLGGVPHRLILRDLAGLRLHAGRLADAGVRLDLWPGSVVGTEDENVLLAKVAYTAFQAHLGDVVHALGLGPDAWAPVRGIVDETYEGLAAYAPVAAKADHAFFTAPTVPHKALVRMRLAAAGERLREPPGVRSGDVYVPMENPLHA
ncbi:IucA/IucC family protein [Hamadaea tsunoensis]|uniref:IucA/IucC family protein n=1 Tax=Hamadaea tsunoensis TaxID=53368 RepID=UPI0004174059|nr:IucA/IucC family protein [Hamadaea tsunoensis]